MKHFLLWVWQLPQNIIGFFMTRKLYCIGNVGDGINFNVFYKKNFFNGSGVCLGDYIILDYKYIGLKDRKAQRHEYGHHLQSIKLGWLYLLVVGLPSIVRNIYDRIFHKKWTKEKRMKWYYSSYPEQQADKLGQVER